MMRVRLLLVALVILGTSFVSGCSTYGALAARYAQAEEDASAGLVPLGTLLSRLCRKEAEYEFLDRLLEVPSKETAGRPSWPAWYAETEARPGPGGRKVTWQSRCDDATRAADVIRKILVALRSHARSLATVAGAKDFDGSGFAQSGAGIGALAGQLGASSGFSSAAGAAGSALEAVAAQFVTLYRDKSLKDAIADSDAGMQAVFTHLTALCEILGQELQLAQEDRAHVLKGLAKRESDPAFARTVGLAEAFELGGEEDMDLATMREALRRYTAAIRRMADSHRQLALFGRAHGPDTAVQAALTDLESSAEALVELGR